MRILCTVLKPTSGTARVAGYDVFQAPIEALRAEIVAAARAEEAQRVTLTVRPTKGGATLGLRLELGGRALFGPVSSAAARAVKGDVEKSLKQFVELYG